MRELTTLSDEHQAHRFAAYLAVQSIQCNVDEDEGQWTVWVHDDDDLPAARKHLEQYQQDPEHERYAKAERKVRHVIQEADRLSRENQKRTERLRQRWEGTWYRCYPATYILIGLCVLVSIVCTDWSSEQPSRWGVPNLCNDSDSKLLQNLTIMDEQMMAIWQKSMLEGWAQSNINDFVRTRQPEQLFKQVPFVDGKKVHAKAGWEGLQAIVRSGEVWRPITPFFIHLNVIHILMNLMALRALGMGIEYLRGTPKFLLLCLLVAIPSHLIQLFWDGPAFGGASGVLFGLIGYAWMKGKTTPQDGIGLSQRTVTFCLFWLILCISGALGPIANAAHIGGLLAGMVIGGRTAIWQKLPFTKSA
ncbi:MAG: hypothetical protein Fues2KO_27170 [Fuerstiella sp.]